MSVTLPTTSQQYDELRTAIAARLRGEDAGGPPVDGSAAFEWVADTYRKGDRDHRMTVDAVIDSYLDEIADEELWPAEAAANLLDLLQDIGDNLSDRLFAMARSGELNSVAERGTLLHAGLLKCLISIGHKATPDFWWQQFEILGPEYGALIASGLCDHGLEAVMPGLPRLCAHETAKQACRFLWRELADRYGVQAVVDSLQRSKSQLPVETYAMYIGDLDRIGASGSNGRPGIGCVANH